MGSDDTPLRTPIAMGRQGLLKHRLQELTLRFPPHERLDHDPLGIVREQPPESREVAAHIVAPLAYGAATQIRLAARSLLWALGEPLPKCVASLRAGDLRRAAPDWKYRMTTLQSAENYILALGAMLREYGTLEAAWRAETAQRDAGDRESDIVDDLSAWVRALRDRMPDVGRAERYLTPDPATGSATKRWYLMLRWLVRDDDGADLGLWTESVAPSRLVMPIDRHVGGLVRSLGMTSRATVDLKMAREVTARFRVLSPDDPLRWDMSLCHLGISRSCEHRYVEPKCSECGLRGLCRWWVADERGSV